MDLLWANWKCVVRGSVLHIIKEKKATEEKFTQDGWLKTGDIVTISEDGFIEIKDRSKDVIKSGGEWISSVALENSLMGHPSILEAAVIAIPR
jgi:fatty-acyl-CoA synthase